MNQNDPNIGRRVSQPVMKRVNYTGWIIGSAVAVVIILALFMMYDRSGDHVGEQASRHDRRDNDSSTTRFNTRPLSSTHTFEQMRSDSGGGDAMHDVFAAAPPQCASVMSRPAPHREMS